MIFPPHQVEMESLIHGCAFMNNDKLHGCVDPLISKKRGKKTQDRICLSIRFPQVESSCSSNDDTK